MAAKLAGENPDYHREDLFNAIENGDLPAWKLYVQIMPLEDADTYRFDPFSKYTLHNLDSQHQYD